MELQLVLDQPQLAGPLALFPVFSDAPPASAYLPGALAADLLEVTEREDGAAVPELSFETSATFPYFASKARPSSARSRTGP
jgi:hypothetical protein